MKPKLRNAAPRRPIYNGVSGRIARAVDAAVGLIAPGTAHRMQLSRMKSSALIAYESAQITRTNPATQTASADGEVLNDLPRLRELSRTMVRDDAHAASTLNILEEAIVGDGITPQAMCKPEDSGMTPDQCSEWDAACMNEWTRWAKQEADATEVGTFYDIQSLALRSWLQDGDAFGHVVIGGDGLLRVEMIDADRVESPRSFDTFDIRGGIELGPHSERVALYVLPHHPADSFPGQNWAADPVRIPFVNGQTSMVQHVFKRTRPGQTRGVPVFTPSLLYTRHLHHYLDSELIAARAASNFALFIKRGVSSTDADIMPVQDTEESSGVEYHEQLEAGTIEYLNEGEEPVPFNPNRPGGSFDPFVTRILRATSASCGLSYEHVARDFGRMNLSSARALLRETRRGFDLTRQRFNHQFNRPHYHNVIRAAVAAGRLTPPSRKDYLNNTEAFLAHRWVPPAYAMMDPKTDVEASTMAVAANLATPFDEAARQGLDAEQVLRERARFIQRSYEVEDEFDLPRGTLTNPDAELVSGEQEAVGGEIDGDDSEPADGEDVAAQKARLDAIGVAVRGGLITPQQQDEERVRADMGLPPMTPAVSEAWAAEPVRRPVTLAAPSEAATEAEAEEKIVEPPPFGDAPEEDEVIDEQPTDDEAEEAVTQ